METKRCSKCREEKPLEEFFKNERTSTGYTSYCKNVVLLLLKSGKKKIRKE